MRGPMAATPCYLCYNSGFFFKLLENMGTQNDTKKDAKYSGLILKVNMRPLSQSGPPDTPTIRTPQKNLRRMKG
jgi:hypothetical protein